MGDFRISKRTPAIEAHLAAVFQPRLTPSPGYLGIASLGVSIAHPVRLDVPQLCPLDGAGLWRKVELACNTSALAELGFKLGDHRQHTKEQAAGGRVHIDILLQDLQ